MRMFGVRGLNYALQAKLLTSSPDVVVNTSDLAHPLRVRLRTSDIDAWIQVFEGREYECLPTFQPKTIIDAGANVGMATVYFANRYPEARIVAVEPETSNFCLLQKNVAPYPNVTPIQAALWSENTLLSLIDPGLGKWGYRTSRIDAAMNDRTSQKVAAFTVEQIMSDYEFDSVDILKIDIEGAEKEVFENSSPWINRVRLLIVELHEHLKPGCTRSFYNATNCFQHEWHKGENIFLERESGKRPDTPRSDSEATSQNCDASTKVKSVI